MRTRRIAALTLVLILCISLLIPSALARWTNTSSITKGLSFDSDKTAYCAVTIAGEPGTSQIFCTLTLLKKSGSNWVHVDSLFGAKPTDILDVYFKHEDCVSGAVYKTMIDCSVYRNGTWEDVIVYSSEKTCP